MIELSGIMGIPLLKKSRFTGSDGDLKFVLEKRSADGEKDRLAAVCWFGETCSDATLEEQKKVRLFPFPQYTVTLVKGLKDAQKWLNEQLSGG